MSSKVREVADILEELSKLNESQFRKLIVNYFRDREATADETHSATERGADIIAVFERDKDVIGRQLIIFIQAKVGKIGISEWRKHLCAQMSQLYYRPPETTTSNNYSARRILLITTGNIMDNVRTEIANWNQRVPIPVEAFTGWEFAALLLEGDFTAEDVKKLLNPKDIAPRPQARVTGAPAPPTRDITVAQVGSEDAVEFL